MGSRLFAGVAVIALFVGCSSDEDDRPADTAAAIGADVADAYALEKSGGERTGCASAAPGPDAEADPGCIYAAAFAGCLEGLTGEQTGPLPPEEEFATEPGLLELYDQAVAECGP